MNTFVILTLLLAGGQPAAKAIQRESPIVARMQTPAQLYAAGIAAAAAKRWDVAAQRFREAIAGDALERAGYFPHYWLGVAYDELHDTAKAVAEWQVSQRQRAIAGTPEEAAMRTRLSVQRRSVVPFRPPVPIQHIHQPLPPPVPLTTQGEVMALDTAATAPTVTTATTSVTATTSTTTAATDTAAATETTVTSTEHHHDVSTPEGQLLEEIDKRFRALNPGQMVINAPQTMRVGEAERLVLRIASAGQNAGIGADLSGPSTTSEIHVTPTMRATLAGNGFTIAPISPEEQFIGGGFTEWSWHVTPTDSGDRELVVSVMVVLDGRVKAIPKVWPVHVSANVGLTLAHFFASYWQWIITVLIIPLVGVFWQRRKKA